MTDTTTIVPTDKAIELAAGGLVTFADFLRTVAKVETSVAAPAPDLPQPITLTVVQRDAFERLPGLLDEPVCPVERRALSVTEIVELLDEREMLDAVADVIEARKAAHRAAVFNHMDVLLEAHIPADRPDQDDKGHYLVKEAAGTPIRPRQFSKELRTTSPVLTAEALKAQVGEDTGFTHDDYLACTTEVRVLDEAKTLLHLRKKPGIVSAIRRATTPGSTTASLYVRKRK